MREPPTPEALPGGIVTDDVLAQKPSEVAGFDLCKGEEGNPFGGGDLGMVRVSSCHPDSVDAGIDLAEQDGSGLHSPLVRPNSSPRRDFGRAVFVARDTVRVRTWHQGFEQD